jgi:hypothetical protein
MVSIGGSLKGNGFAPVYQVQENNIFLKKGLMAQNPPTG